MQLNAFCSETEVVVVYDLGSKNLFVHTGTLLARRMAKLRFVKRKMIILFSRFQTKPHEEGNMCDSQ